MERAANIGSATSRSAWFSLLALCAILVLYFDTFASMVRIWYTIDTFTYAFLVFPISIYLIWQERDRLRQLHTLPSVIGLISLCALSMLWWLSNTVGVQVVGQLAVVAMISATILTFMGPVFTRAIAFPLVFLLLAVPFGEFLTPYMIDFTATFTVETLHALGIPVNRDGAYFHIPTGSYEVAKACSGIRFVIATFALSVLLSHFFFERFARKLAFIVLAVVLALAANGIRATMVVLLLHMTDMDIAAGQDHEFVGWLVYLVLMVLLLALGRKFQDRTYDESPVTGYVGEAQKNSAAFLLLAALAIAVGPVFYLAGQMPRQGANDEAPRFPVATTGWITKEFADPEWQPAFSGFAGMRTGSFYTDAGRVDLAIIRYLGQRQGGEISNASNSVVEPESWKIMAERTFAVELGESESIALQEVSARHRADGYVRLVWYWIEVNETPVYGALQTKWAEIKSAITLTQSRSSAVILSANIGQSSTATRQLLQDFVREYYTQLRECMNRSDDHDACNSDMSFQEAS